MMDIFPTPQVVTNPDHAFAKSIHDFTMYNIHGEPVKLDVYEGHICLLVNVATKCGFAYENFKQLNELYSLYAESKGLRILAFPCNQFGDLEPGTAEDIIAYIKKMDVKFDVFAKIDVNGSSAHELFKYLKSKIGGHLGDFIKWNFTKFIINRNGIPVARHPPETQPLDLVKHLEECWKAASCGTS